MNTARAFISSSSSAPARSISAPLACPTCESDLENGEVYLNTVVRDPEGKARLEIVLECPECGTGWYVFVAAADFLRNPISGEAHA